MDSKWIPSGAALAAASPGPYQNTTQGTVADPQIGSRGLTIRQRLTLIVFAVAVPILMLSIGIIWQLASRERETSRQAVL
jgi:hypothetical protein